MGNMGFSTTKCQQSGMAADKFYISCPTGLIGHIVDFGITASYENKDLCVNNSTGACVSSFNSTKMRSDIETTCLSKKNCTFSGIKNYVTSNKTTCQSSEA
jgi:hypothetical protein